MSDYCAQNATYRILTEFSVLLSQIKESSIVDVSLLLVFERDFDFCAIGNDFSFFHPHIELNGFCDS